MVVTKSRKCSGFVIYSYLKDSAVTAVTGNKGWPSGESACLPPLWPGLKSRRRSHMWVEFVVGSLLCSGRFFSGYSRFPLSSKTNISKFQFDWESGRRRTTLWMCYLQIIINYLFKRHAWFLTRYVKKIPFCQ